MGFNPRSREGSDPVFPAFFPRGRSFNPRSREGATTTRARLDAIITGAWIETAAPGKKSGEYWVAPLAGAWIETLIIASSLARVVVAPSRERGLKLPGTAFTAHRCDVAPLGFNPRSREGSDPQTARVKRGGRRRERGLKPIH